MAMRPNRSGGVNSSRLGRVYEELKPISEWKQEQDSDILLVYLPGFPIEYINITTENKNILRIRGERLIAGNKWCSFQEDFQVPENCDMTGVRAKFVGGIITVTMPRKITTPKGDTTITRVPKQEATAEIKPVRPPRSTIEQDGGASAIPSTSTPGMKPRKPFPSGEVEGDAPPLEKEYRPLNTNHKSKKTTEEETGGTQVIPSIGTTEIKPIRLPSGKLEEDAPLLEKQETPPSTNHPSKSTTKEAGGTSVIFSTSVVRIKPIMHPSGKLEDTVASLEKQDRPLSINHPLNPQPSQEEDVVPFVAPEYIKWRIDKTEVNGVWVSPEFCNLWEKIIISYPTLLSSFPARCDHAKSVIAEEVCLLISTIFNVTGENVSLDLLQYWSEKLESLHYMGGNVRALEEKLTEMKVVVAEAKARKVLEQERHLLECNNARISKCREALEAARKVLDETVERSSKHMDKISALERDAQDRALHLGLASAKQIVTNAILGKEFL